MTDWTEFIIPVSISVAATFGISRLVFKFQYKKVSKQKNQVADRGSVNVRGITNSNITIVTGSEPKPIEATDTTDKDSTLENSIREILKKIRSQKISALLQQAKLIAIDTNDKEMQNWIDRELNGYLSPPGGITNEEAELTGFIPSYRKINGKFFVRFVGKGIEEFTYSHLLGNDIKTVEDLIDRFKQGNVSAFVQITFKEHVPYVGSQTGNLYIQQAELEGVIRGAEGKLSEYLESKLSK